MPTTGKAWGDITIAGGTGKELLISVKDNMGAFMTPSGTHQLWFRNADPSKPTDVWAYDDASFSIVDVAAVPATPGHPAVDAHQALSVTILAGDTIARQGNRYTTQLYRVDTGILMAYGVLAVLRSSIDPNMVPALTTLPVTPTGLLKWNGHTILVTLTVTDTNNAPSFDPNNRILTASNNLVMINYTGAGEEITASLSFNLLGGVFIGGALSVRGLPTSNQNDGKSIWVDTSAGRVLKLSS